MMQQCAMMQQQGMTGPDTMAVMSNPSLPTSSTDAVSSSMPSSTTDRSNLSAEKVQAKKKLRAEKDEKVTTVFVGGLRKSTSEDKVTAHFAKFGQVDNVDIKRLPDGTSRGFAFVKFIERDSV